MRVTQENGSLSVTASTYSLTFPSDRPFVYVNDSCGARLMELFALSSIHPLHDRDDTTGFGAWEVAETPDEIMCSLRAQSSVWITKTYTFRCRPQRFTYDIEVEGEGRLAEVNYFGGYSSAQMRWGSGFFRSGRHVTRGFNPEPIAEETHDFQPSEGAHIDLGGVPLPGKGDWFFTPPPFCFAFQGANTWIGIGVEAEPGAHQWTEYRYHGGRGCYLSLAYEGHTAVHESYTLPAIGFDFGADEYDVLCRHADAVRSRLPMQPRSPAKPAWWHEPIMCGWGSQFYLARREGRPAPACARQSLYDQFLATLEAQDIVPGIVVIDDKWQATYGDNQADETKWPDLRGFIDRQHAEGKKVLLWLKAWDREGVPIGECITNAAGAPLTVDPSNPRYQRRLRASVRRLLSADGYDADGFKIDFTARIPGGPGIRTCGDAWGLELMKLLLRTIYDAAKTAKPDALIITHTPHPYLADALDMIRLNDALQLERLSDPRIGRDMARVMAQRARIAAIACPDAIIDTDNWPVRNRAAWREYVRQQPDIGVPSLYFSSHIDITGEPLEAADYALIRESWARYRAQQPDAAIEQES